MSTAGEKGNSWSASRPGRGRRAKPGMDVAQINGNTWAISARGLNGQFSNELLVLIDGRNVYTPTFGGVNWDTVNVTPEDIERIEVIRGPGAAVWGDNAANGVVNIIRKKAGETQGVMVSVGGGNTVQEFTTLRYGGRAGQHTDYRIFAKYFNRDNETGLTAEDGGDGWHLSRAGFRTDTELTKKDSLTVEGDIYSGREGDPATDLASITASPAPRQLFVNLSGGFIQGIWEHRDSDRASSTVMASYDQYERSNQLGDQRKTAGLDFHRDQEWGRRQQWVYGAGLRWSDEDSQGTLALSFEPANQTTKDYNAFVQDEIAVIPERLYVTLGTKLEWNTYSHFGMMPTARVMYAFSNKRTAWAAVSRALRTPSETDVSQRLNIAGFVAPDGTPTLVRLLGNPQARDEGVVAYEVGYRTTLRKNISLDISAYYNDYDNQDSTEPGTPFFEATPAPPHLVMPLTLANLVNGETHGIEIAGNWKVNERWTLTPSYDFQRMHFHSHPPSQDTETGPETEGGGPHEHGQIRSHLELPHRMDWDASATFTGRLEVQGVASYTRLDTGLSWRWKERLTLSVVGQNLQKAQHLEFVDSDGATHSTAIRRNWYAKMTWQF